MTGSAPKSPAASPGIPSRAAPGVRVEDYGIRGLHLAYDLLAGVDLLVLVDTVPPDSRAEHGTATGPGSIRVLRVGTEDLDSGARWIRTAWTPSRSWAGSVRWAVSCRSPTWWAAFPPTSPRASGFPPRPPRPSPRAVQVIGELLAQHTSVQA